jgi:predicted nucleic acid-binding protein
MRHVVDASVSAKWFIPELHSENALRLLTDFLEEKLELMAPDLMVVELANLLWTRSARGDISQAKAAQGLAEFLALGLDLRASSALSATALKLATTEKHPVYDMMYVSLAQQEGCELVTADQKMINKLGKKLPLLRWIGDF